MSALGNAAAPDEQRRRAWGWDGARAASPAAIVATPCVLPVIAEQGGIRARS
jgi:hypothetical protein